MDEAAINYRSVLEQESQRFAEALTRGPLDAAVAGCPGWTLQDLGGHLGGIQRWCTGILVTGAPSEFGDGPGDADPASWFSEGTAALLEALDNAPPEDACWTFAGPGTNAFWHRRQALEAVVHRWDAESAADGPVNAIDAAVAADVVDEWVNLFIARRLPQDATDLAASGLDGDVHLHCTDVPGEWTFEMVDGALAVVGEHRKSAVAIKGAAHDLALFAYRRGDDSNIEIFGDQELLGRWLAAMG